MLKRCVKIGLSVAGALERWSARRAPAPAAISPQAIRHILIWSMDRLGDLVRATPAIRAVRTCFPDSHLALVAAGRAGPILRENPHLDALHIVPNPYRLTQHRRLRNTLRDRNWDLVILLEADTHWDVLGGLLARRLGARHVLRFDFGRGVPRGQHGVQLGTRGSWIDQFNRLVAICGTGAPSQRTEVFLSDAECAAAVEFLAAAGIAPAQPFILIHPGGNFLTVSRQWPPAEFARLISLLRQEWPHPIVLTGVAAELPAIDEIRRLTPEPIVDLCGRLSLRQLAAMIDRAAVCIMNDTGPLHVAHALGRPTVALLGPTAPEVVGIPPHSIAVRADLPCSPCAFLAGWQACSNPVRWECLQRIEPQDVTAAVRQHLAGVAARPQRRHELPIALDSVARLEEVS